MLRRELAFGFKPNFLVLPDGTVTSMPDFACTSSDGFVRNAKRTGGVSAHNRMRGFLVIRVPGAGGITRDLAVTNGLLGKGPIDASATVPALFSARKAVAF